MSESTSNVSKQTIHPGKPIRWELARLLVEFTRLFSGRRRLVGKFSDIPERILQDIGYANGIDQFASRDFET